MGDSRLAFVEVVAFFVAVAAMAVVFAAIIRKTGRSRVDGLLLIVPIANSGVLVWIAYSEWPIERELRRLRAASAQGAK